MPRNGSGVYTLPAGNPVVPGTTIDAAWANSTLEDMANEITNSLSRTGAGGMIAPFRIADGNITAPGLAFLNETGSGLYRSGTASVWMAIQGVNTAQFTTTGVNIPAGKTLAAGGNATVGGNLAVTGTIASTGGVFNTTIDSITNKVGADHIHFKVKATQTLVKGDVVKVTGYNVGDAAFEVAKVSSATDVAVGIVYNNIANGALGAIVNTGLLENIDTSAFTAGQILYPTTSGGLTATKPSSGQYQAIAFVLRSNANNGAILIEASEPLFVQASTNTGNTLVLRDGSGNFSAGTITASLTGNVTGNVSGNAGTVTNGVYTTGSYSDPSWLVSLAGSKVSGNISGNAANVTGTVAIANGGTGSTTAGGARTALDVPTRTGGDASGTWGISITGNAANVTGTVAIANGGTGATTASSARTNLGLAIGTDVPSPTGTGASGTWGINITGNAATVTNGVVTTGSYSDPSWITALAGSKITGNISGNAANVTGTVAVANGGTGATSASGARVNLLPSYTSNELKALRVNAAGTDVEWFTVSAGGDVAGPASATDNALVRFDATTGKLIQNSVGILSDTGDLSGIAALSMSGALTLSGGTANGVAYLNGSKVLTTGSALTFDGTNFNAPASIVSGSIGGIYANSYSAGNQQTWLLNNATASDTYRQSDTAQRFRMLTGVGFAWETAASGTAGGAITWSEQMRLTSTGLGIGTSSPQSGVHINKPFGSQLRIQEAGGTYFDIASGGRFDLKNAAGTTIVSIAQSGSPVGTQLNLDSSGNLGLGVTPSAWWANTKALQVGAGMAIEARTADATVFSIGANQYIGASTNRIYLTSNVASLYEQNTGQHRWYTAPSGTAGNAISFSQVMTLDASGNLGVGTTSPSSRIHLATAAGTAPKLYIGQAATSAWSVGSPASVNALVFIDEQFSAERARITSGGDLLVGVTALNNAGGLSIHPGTAPYCTLNKSLTGTQDAFYFEYNGAIVGKITYSDTATAYVTSSDYRLKENIQPMQNALGVVAQLNPVTYNWKADGSAGQGFIAHELQAVVPDCVTGEKDAVDAEGKPVYQGIDTSFLVATLTAAIQEQQAIITDLRARVAALEAA